MSTVNHRDTIHHHKHELTNYCKSVNSNCIKFTSGQKLQEQYMYNVCRATDGHKNVTYTENNDNNDRLTAFDPGQPG